MKGNISESVLWAADELTRALNLPIQHCGNKIVIDSREVTDGCIFIGLPGSRVNGSDFYHEALQRGAALIFVDKVPSGLVFASADGILTDSEPITPNREGYIADKCILVGSGQTILKKLAAYRRQQISGKVIAVTGSAGKTTTKEMLKLVLPHTFATQGNFNNALGLPLSIANIPRDGAYTVLELGMSKPGEMVDLSALAQPDVAIITNIAAAHLASFNSLEDIAYEKASIFNHLTSGGIAILNRDDHYYPLLREIAARYASRIVTFGQHRESDVMLLSAEFTDALKVRVKCDRRELDYCVNHRSHIAGSLASIATAYALNLDYGEISEKLRNFHPPKGRGHLISYPKLGVDVLDETYNANPLSMRLALQNFMERATRYNRAIVVLGDMLELGEDAERYHEELLRSAIQSGVHQIFLVGNLMNHCGNIVPENLRGGSVEKVEDMIPILFQAMQKGDLVLLKGSQGMGLGKVVAAMALI